MDGATGVRGVVVLGGAHGALALARSLRHTGLPVWHVTDGHRLAGSSRWFHRTLLWPGAGAPAAVEFLLQAARLHEWTDYLLLAAADAEVRLVSQACERLASAFLLATIPWTQLSWACEKSKAYRRAGELGIGIPRTYHPTGLEDVRTQDIRFPVVLKPSIQLERNPFTRAKAWRADDLSALVLLYRRAVELVGSANVVLQELVPGDGQTQFSYAGLWDRGMPVSEFTALRHRQFPTEFGTGTYVQVVEQPEVAALARRFLASIAYHGLVEMEFKRDPRDGGFKLIDVNPRLWTWFGLAEAAGVDFGPKLLAVARGATGIAAGTPRIGAAWAYLPRDAASAWQLVSSGSLSAGQYLRTLACVRSWGVFDVSDPVPALCDLPMAAWRALSARAGGRRSGPARA
jgi:predicted ATP-grasp superfamily ATP-dependent carboligase